MKEKEKKKKTPKTKTRGWAASGCTSWIFKKTSVEEHKVFLLSSCSPTLCNWHFCTNTHHNYFSQLSTTQRLPHSPSTSEHTLVMNRLFKKDWATRSSNSFHNLWLKYRGSSKWQSCKINHKHTLFVGDATKQDLQV